MTTIPTVEPVAADTGAAQRPTWSVMIPVHDDADMLPETLAGVVEQLHGRDDVEIVVVDDVSTDDPASVVERDGRGMVRYVRLDRPHGAIANFNACVRHSRGRFVHLLHGDDGVLPGFYDAMEAALQSGEAVAALCRARYVDEEGHRLVDTRSERTPSGWWGDALPTLAVSNRVRPAAIVVARGAYETIGAYREDLPHAADWDMWARLAASGPIWFVDEVLATYRVHSGSDTAGRILTGVNITERIEAIDVIGELLPPSQRRRLRRRALAYSAVYALRTAARCATRRQVRGAGAQLVGAGRCVLAMVSAT